MIRYALVYFFLFGTMGAVFPYLQLFLRARGFSEAQVGVLQGLMTLAGVAGPLVVGHLADRTGRPRALLALALVVFGVLLIPLSTTARFGVAALLMCGIGFFFRNVIPLTDTIVSSHLEDAARNYGRVRVWGSIGFVVTLVAVRLLGLVDEGSSASMARAMLICATGCLAVVHLLPTGAGSREHVAARARGDVSWSWVFWIFLLAVALHQCGMTAYYSFFSLYLHDVCGLEQAAWVWALGTACETPMLFFAGAIIARLGLVNMLMLAMAGATFRMAVYALQPPLAVVLSVQVCHALTFGLMHAASIEFVRRHAPAARRGLAMALYMSVGAALPGLVGSSVGGWVLERWGYTMLYGIYACVPLPAIAMLALLRRRIMAHGRR